MGDLPKMRCIIAGSRNYNYMYKLEEVINTSEFEITEVVSGGCRGVDQLGERWAREHNIPIKQFPADWQKYGKRAGPIRNRLMGEYADAGVILAYPDSRGSHNMLDVLMELKKDYYIEYLSYGDNP